VINYLSTVAGIVNLVDRRQSSLSYKRPPLSSSDDNTLLLTYVSCMAKYSKSRVCDKVLKGSTFNLGIVELCAKILQIMRNDFKDYARTFCQLCAPFSVLYYT